MRREAAKDTATMRIAAPRSSPSTTASVGDPPAPPARAALFAADVLERPTPRGRSAATAVAAELEIPLRPQSPLEGFALGVARAVGGVVKAIAGCFSSLFSPRPAARDGEVLDVARASGAHGGRPVFVVNGAGADLDAARAGAAAVGDATGRDVKLILNATQHGIADVDEAKRDMRGDGASPAARTVAALALDAMRAGAPIEFVGHSAGTAAIANGLRIAARAFEVERGAAATREALSRVRFLSVSGPIDRGFVPDGVDYRFALLPGDPVARAGEGFAQGTFGSGAAHTSTADQRAAFIDDVFNPLVSMPRDFAAHDLPRVLAGNAASIAAFLR